MLVSTGEEGVQVLNQLKRILSRRPKQFPELADVTLHPIGVVRSRIKETGDSRDWQQTECSIIIRPELTGALLGLDTYSHVMVLFWPHLVPDEVRGSKHRLHPRDDPQNPLQGILATRSQIRFNPILVTTVVLLNVKRNVLRVRGLDAIDGTPVLDVKPYIPHFDSVPGAKAPEWISEMAARENAPSRSPVDRVRTKGERGDDAGINHG